MKKGALTIGLLILTTTYYVKAQVFLTDEINIPCTSVKFQGRTGTCWSYATTSFIESELIRMEKGKFDLSEMFLVRQTYLDKSNNYILRQGNCQFDQGALAFDALSSIKKYGTVPQDVYPEIWSDEDMPDHTELYNGLKGFLDAVIVTGYPGEHWMNAVEGILDSYLGEISNVFTFNGIEYTPISFAEELDLPLAEYVNITSFTHHPFYENFILELPDNFSNGKSYNVPLEEFIFTINYALEHGYSIVWDGEMKHEKFTPNHPWIEGWDGLLIELSDEIIVNQETRQKAFQSYQTEDEHLMHIVGRAKDENGNVFYLVKDSVYGSTGPYQGFVYMSEDYLKMRTISITVHKNGLSTTINDKL